MDEVTFVCSYMPLLEFSSPVVVIPHFIQSCILQRCKILICKVLFSYYVVKCVQK